MGVTRRGIFRSMIGAGLTTPAISQGVAAATSNVTVSGKVESAVDTSIEGNQVVLVHQETIQWYRAEIQSDGAFQESVPEDGTYDLVYFHQPLTGDIIGDFDNVPVIYDLGQVDLTQQGKDLGSYTIPEGYVAEIRIVDGNGNPLENVPLSFYVPSGAGTGPRAFTTNENGQVVNTNKVEPGIELRDKVTVSTHAPDGPGNETLGVIYMDEDKQFEMVLRNPEKYEDIIVHSSDNSATDTPTESPTSAATPTPTVSEETDSAPVTGTPTSTQPEPSATTTEPTTATPESQSGEESQRQRGFFSNSAEGEPEFLSNIFNLTMLGFLLSVGGIIHQMMEG